MPDRRSGRRSAATTRDPKVCIVLAEGFGVDPQQTLEAVARGLPDGVVIVGGTSAGRDFGTPQPSFQFCGDVVVDDGVAILLFSGPVLASTAVGTGWRTLGATGTVTSSGSGVVVHHRWATGYRIPGALPGRDRPGVVREPAVRDRGRR